MALRKNLVHRLLNTSKTAVPTTTSSSTTTSGLLPTSSRHSRPPSPPSFLDRLFHQSTTIPDHRLSLPIGDKLIEKLKGFGTDRVRLDSLFPPATSPEKTGSSGRLPISVEEVRKVLRVSQMEAVKERLRIVPSNSIPYSEFVEICGGNSGSLEHGLGIAKSLDDSGAVIVLGNVVFLHPEQVARAIESVIPRPEKEEEKENFAEEELREMERRKAEIDEKAAAGTRRELRWGLGLVAAQTVGLMRLTFWELSWDVMEPICFFVTSAYFIAGYAFFLRTSKEPSFEGFFHCRFAARQSRLMKATEFDLRRFNELRRVLRRPSSSSSPNSSNNTTEGPLPSSCSKLVNVLQ